MITKRSKDYVPYLYTQVKYKSITVYLKTFSIKVNRSHRRKKVK